MKLIHKDNLLEQEEWIIKKYKKKIEKGAIYFLDGDKFYKAEIFDNGYYQLRYYKGAPMLEINGFRMQNIKGFNSVFDYAKEVVRLLEPKGKILECCFGLGYITRELIKYGDVISIEKNRAVLELAKINPYSKEVLDRVINKDIIEYLKESEEVFDSVVHDPPSYSQAPELYSRSFYKLLDKHVKKGTKLYHYTGEPGIKKGKKIYEGVEKRLQEFGWKTEYNKRLKGIFAVKIF